MALNGSALFLDRETRVLKIQQIAAFLAQIEGKDPADRSLHGLAQKFENQIFTAAMNVEDYNNRINKKLSKVRKVRQQQALHHASMQQQQQQQQQGMQQAPPVQQDTSQQQLQQQLSTLSISD